MTAHKHAAAMMQYAEDAAKSATPWEKWEARRADYEWSAMTGHPSWLANYEYRRKAPKRFLLVGDKKIKLFEVEPEYETPYFYISADEVCETQWDNMRADRLNFKENNCFRTREDAEQVLEAVQHIFNNVVEE